MKIAPIDIAHKSFSKKMLGFDQDEVIEFLRDVADQMEEIIRERNSLKEGLREKDLSIMEYRDRDETLKATITTATRMSEQIRTDAERESKLIIADAQQKAEMMIKDAKDSLKRIYQEIAEVKRARIQFEASLRSLLHGHMAMLDQGSTMLPEIGANSVLNSAGANPMQQTPAQYLSQANSNLGQSVANMNASGHQHQSVQQSNSPLSSSQAQAYTQQNQVVQQNMAAQAAPRSTTRTESDVPANRAFVHNPIQSSNSIAINTNPNVKNRAPISPLSQG